MTSALTAPHQGESPQHRRALPVRLHHYALVVRDQEQVRHFMEDVLGFPLVATWAERAMFHDVGEEHEYCHTFYELDGGGALAFFQFADPKMYERCQAKAPAEISRFHHIALRVDSDRFEDLRQRLEAAGLPNRVRDHGYCQSLYTCTSDGLQLEFTVDAPNLSEIESDQRRNAHGTLARWLKGDHSPNNDIRH
jgi:catechol 2,3-dioxygenase-like lactoylglutathione lyase family enzyme